MLLAASERVLNANDIHSLTMTDLDDSIRVLRGENDGELCTMFHAELVKYVTAIPESRNMKGPVPGSKEAQQSRPSTLPEGSIFLCAETGPAEDPVPVGSMCLVPRHRGAPNFEGLPNEIEMAGEIKRAIVLDGHRGKGVAGKLIEALEETAKTDLGLKYLVVETWWALKGAQALYEKHGFRARSLWGAYDARDSLGFEKWL